MLKSLKLGELGIERDPLVLPSCWRSEDVLRSKVRSIVDIREPQAGFETRKATFAIS